MEMLIPMIIIHQYEIVMSIVEIAITLAHYSTGFWIKKVQVGNYQEKAQSKKRLHFSDDVDHKT